ncbi:hypothetical protein AGABI2DRAFT_118406 [Agaricus bisporus var. bisporus H97]|uniref:hypothetical protein n=1 Tax=Agaricus bisporus var. bisporus (strain H97 / ATCC MYA-4626 / FGSC 10389) TaxID=936046 RepID=UPI00029F4F0E|nr:hypothetical protein AGABI2DRAFT_118406 [Agaricus bisporus var. bisporus H97]EKV46200.1 hypothetical protein AGABI2DRAFT_118406 [Agaricus bisporus var. bisporus H97]
MEASFIGNKQVDPRNLPQSSTQKIPDEELNKREAERLKEGAKEPGANKAAGAASRNPQDYDTSKRGGQGDTQPQAEQSSLYEFVLDVE